MSSKQPNNMQLAYEAVLGGSMSQRTASTTYGVSRTALQRRIHGVVEVAAKNGPAPILRPGEEEGIVQAILERSLRGACFETRELKHLIRKVIVDSPYERTIPSEFPSDRYMNKFVQRHKERIGYRSAQILDSKRAKMSTEDNIRQYYANLEKLMKDKQYAPECIWNLDETGISPQVNYHIVYYSC